MFRTANLAEWYAEHGKHAVYANPKKGVPLPEYALPVALQVPASGSLLQIRNRNAAARAPSSQGTEPVVALS